MHYPTQFKSIFSNFWKYRELIIRMAKREVIGRYNGSVLGLLWSFFNPIVMLFIYTFFFTVIFKARWGTVPTSKTEFAVILFAGLIIYNLFAECINKAPVLVTSNVNYVKKVIFPLEILPWVNIGASLFHAAISTIVLLAFYFILNLHIAWTIIFFPLVLIPFIFFIMGISWFLAALGVYVRDTVQVMGVLTTILLFASPIFYSVTMLPEKYRWVFYLNPLTFVVEQTRNVLILGNIPHWIGLLLYLIGSLIVAWLGFYCFQKMRKGFADVI